MALLMFDGFDYMGYDSNSIDPMHWSSGFSGIFSCLPGRDAGFAVIGTPLLTKPLTVTGNTLVVGCDIQITGSYHNSYKYVMALVESGAYVVQLVRTASTGPLDLWFNGALYQADVLNGRLLGPDEWVNLEVKVVIDAVAGRIVVRRAGVEEYDSGNMDTTAGGTFTTVDTVEFGSSSSTYDYLTDNVYVLDGSGTEFNDFLGPVQIEFVPPAAEDTVQFTPLSGTDNSLMVDDWPGLHDADATYNTSGVAGDTDFFTLPTLPVTSLSPTAVSPIFNAKTEGGANNMAGVIKSNVTEAEGPPLSLIAGYLTYVDTIFTTDPDTGAAWTKDAVQALKVGYRNKG